MEIKKANLIYPYFVVPGENKKDSIGSFPGQYRFSVDRLLPDIKESVKLGLDKVLLFGVPDSKDAVGTSAYKKGNIVSMAVSAVKKEFPNIIVFTDVCLCSYTIHGHCGILRHSSKTNDERRTTNNALIDNKATLEALAKIAVSHAGSGADYVAPSAMAKGEVGAIRAALDRSGYKRVKIMGYSAKFASSFYGPFRNAADSAPKFGDRKGYQLDYTDPETALERIAADIKEGADIVMVKPALAYLDIIYRAKKRFDVPLAAYNVSGEYAFMGGNKDMISEVLSAIKRAGADYIITYHAKEAAKWLNR